MERLDLAGLPVEVLISVAFLIGIFLFVRFYYAWPEYPPLETDPNDPLMQEASRQAKSSLGQLVSLYPANKERAIVKIRFISNSEQTEYLWGEVRDLKNGKADIFLITPPVTHSGKLERTMTVPLAELEDWQITDAEGKIYGAFTQRAMLKIARARWGKLPKKLQKIEKLYS